MTPAPELVGDDVIVGVVDHEQLAVVDLGTVDQSCIVGSSLTAPTAGFDLNLDPFVGHLEETLGTGEQFSLKAGEQPEGEHVGAEVVNIKAQLKAMEENRFMVTTHEQTAGYAAMKGAERDRWVGGMRKLRRMLVEANNGRPL